MPSRERVQEFIDTVVSGEHVRAIADFYHPNATMQENGEPPRRGRDALIRHEEAALQRVGEMFTHEVDTHLVDGDMVVIRWTFEFVDKKGIRRRLEELALQRWDDDRIAEERFFYDTASAWQSV